VRGTELVLRGLIADTERDEEKEERDEEREEEEDWKEGEKTGAMRSEEEAERFLRRRGFVVGVVSCNCSVFFFFFSSFSLIFFSFASKSTFLRRLRGVAVAFFFVFRELTTGP
jgi:hypothetical protein